MSECQQVLMAKGVPYPRTCARCGLGPCRGQPSDKKPVMQTETMMNFKPDRQTSIPMHERLDLLDAHEVAELVQMIDFAKTYRRGHEALYQLHAKGPVWDGDLISKNDRDVFLGIGACSKVCVKGEQGFNACTYLGRTLLRIFDWLHGPLPGAEPLK